MLSYSDWHSVYQNYAEMYPPCHAIITCPHRGWDSTTSHDRHLYPPLTQHQPCYDYRTIHNATVDPYQLERSGYMHPLHYSEYDPYERRGRCIVYPTPPLPRRVAPVWLPSRPVVHRQQGVPPSGATSWQDSGHQMYPGSALKSGFEMSGERGGEGRSKIHKELGDSSPPPLLQRRVRGAVPERGGYAAVGRRAPAPPPRSEH